MYCLICGMFFRWILCNVVRFIRIIQFPLYVRHERTNGLVTKGETF